MKALYYQCFAGISGDMHLGALVDLGVDLDYLKSELSKLHLDHEFEIHSYKGDKHGIFGTKVDVIDLNQAQQHDHGHHTHGHEEATHKQHESGHGHDQVHDHAHEHIHDHDHGHSHDHAHPHEHDHDHGHEAPHTHDHTGLRDYKEIKQIIKTSHLSQRVQKMALAIFEEIAIAEAHIHNKSVDEVHFHEVGAIDSIVDVVGAAICIDALGVTQIMASTVELGSGFVRCSHGLMPIPAPATAEILRGVPVKSTVPKFEMTTPTGAAILKAMVHTFTDQLDFTIDKVGYGLGSRDMTIPNLLRVMLVTLPQAKENPEPVHSTENLLETNTEYLLETNIDDMTPEYLAFAQERLFEAGALDVYQTPIIMKKGRSATMLSVLVSCENLEVIKRTLFTNTTAIGCRVIPIEKIKLERDYQKVQTPFGQITLKNAYYNGVLVNQKPEYDQVAAIAREQNITVQAVLELIETRRKP